MPQLDHRKASADFYDDRYARGYMEDWPSDTRARILEVVRRLQLPEAGHALDFGCGNGVLSDLLRQALPGGWTVYGTDISARALENARVRFPGCIFLEAGEEGLGDRRFDLVFTHHVLEHVYDLSGVLRDIEDRLKPDATVLHILPCGNAGSLEHHLCQLREAGIDPARGNRFFFEEEGHLRRLTTAELVAHYSLRGFALEAEYHRNQLHGAVEWITRAVPSFVAGLTDPAAAADESARRALVRWRGALLALWALRYPVTVVELQGLQGRQSVRSWIVWALGLSLYLFAKPVDAGVRWLARREWQERRSDRGGSEMFLAFRRRPGSASGPSPEA